MLCYGKGMKQTYTNHDDSHSSIMKIVISTPEIIIFSRNNSICSTSLSLCELAEELRNNNAVSDVFYYRLRNQLSDEAMNMLYLEAVAVKKLTAQ
jgi:hypothetical protein